MLQQFQARDWLVMSEYLKIAVFIKTAVNENANFWDLSLRLAWVSIVVSLLQNHKQQQQQTTPVDN